MSNGSLQQLASRGVQDAHLSISPETSFFKRSYKRVSQFCFESINIEIPNLSWGQTRTVTIPRTGDLLARLMLVLEIALLEIAAPVDPSLDFVYWTNVLGHAALNYAKFEGGTTEIDQLTGDYLEILHEVGSTVDKDVDELVLRGSSAAQLHSWAINGNSMDSTGADITRLYINLPFYFSHALSQALPVISTQFHDLKVKIALKTLLELIVFTPTAAQDLHATNNGSITNAYLMGTFVFLDSLERRLFAANQHEYLIKNLQVSDYHTKAAAGAGSRVSATVIFNHPTLCLFWFCRTDANRDANDYFNWELTPGQGDDPMISATIKLNGAEREKARDALFFRKLQTAWHFNRTPRKNLYAYSFAASPLDWFPTGSINLSRIDSTVLEFTFRSTDGNGDPYGSANITVLCMNFNVVRHSGGMISIRYAS